MALTLEQTGGVEVASVGDTWYWIGNERLDVRNLAKILGQDAGETHEEHESLILLYLTKLKEA